MQYDVIHRGKPTISKKENHYIYKMEYHTGRTQRSKVLCAVEWSMHKDCTFGEIRKEFWKEYEKLILKPKISNPSFCYMLSAIDKETEYWLELPNYSMEHYKENNEENEVPEWLNILLQIEEERKKSHENRLKDKLVEQKIYDDWRGE